MLILLVRHPVFSVDVICLDKVLAVVFAHIILGHELGCDPGVANLWLRLVVQHVRDKVAILIMRLLQLDGVCVRTSAPSIHYHRCSHNPPKE